MKKVKEIEDIKNLYKKSFQEFGDSHKSVLWPKGRQADRFKALTQFVSLSGGFSVLDFGCGLAHLKEYLDSKYENVNYTGVDMVEDFIDHNKKKFPLATFLSPEEFFEQTKEYDYIFCSGTFNIKYTADYETHKSQIFKTISTLFKRTKQYISVDFMTDRVDFQQESAFHANPEQTMAYFLDNLSRRISLNHSYLPYEFCISIFKNSAVKPPENIYKELT